MPLKSIERKNPFLLETALYSDDFHRHRGRKDLPFDSTTEICPIPCGPMEVYLSSSARQTNEVLLLKVFSR